MSFNQLRKEVINKKLCCRCGSCLAICPNNNLYFDDIIGKYIPKSKGKCIKGCNLCSQVCPGKNINLNEFSNKFTDSEKFQKGLGNYLNIFLGRVRDINIRKNSTSGGAVTAILLALLKKKIIDGCILVGFDSKKPYLAKVKIANNKKDIIEGIQSKYVIVPINQILKELDKNKKYAFVGLPCQVLGLKKISSVNPNLTKNIIFTIGLICHSTMFFKGTKELIKMSGIKNLKKIIEIRYRYGKFPGGFIVRTTDKKTKIIPLKEKYMRVFDKNILNRCRLCIDHFANFADIVAADPFPFLDELKEDKKWTAIIIRNKKGEKIIKEVIKEKQTFEKKEVKNLNIKKWNSKLNSIQSIYLKQLAYDKKIGKKIPECGLELSKVSWIKSIFINPLRVHIFKNIMLSTSDMFKIILKINRKK